MDYDQMFLPAKLHDDEDFKTYETDITVFTIDGCARCSYVSNYLIEKKVDFTVLNTSRDEAVNQYMWDKLRDQGDLTTQPRTPIIMVDGILSHSHEDLKRFLKGLSKGKS